MVNLYHHLLPDQEQIHYNISKLYMTSNLETDKQMKDLERRMAALRGEPPELPPHIKQDMRKFAATKKAATQKKLTLGLGKKREIDASLTTIEQFVNNIQRAIVKLSNILLDASQKTEQIKIYNLYLNQSNIEKLNTIKNKLDMLLKNTTDSLIARRIQTILININALQIPINAWKKHMKTKYPELHQIVRAPVISKRGGGNTRTHKRKHKRTHKRKHKRTHKRKHKRKHKRTHKRKHKRTHTRTHKRTHKRKHKRTHKRKHKRKHKSKRNKTIGGNKSVSCSSGQYEISYSDIENGKLLVGDKVYVKGIGDISLWTVTKIVAANAYNPNWGVEIKKGDEVIFLGSGDLIHEKKRICKTKSVRWRRGGSKCNKTQRRHGGRRASKKRKKPKKHHKTYHR